MRGWKRKHRMEPKSPTVPLIGSPYDLRIGMGESVNEPDVKTALQTGEMGFVHSFQTGSAVDGPGMRLVASLLFDVSPFDPLALGAAPVLLALVALAATVPPAVRASRTDPAVTLRSE